MFGVLMITLLLTIALVGSNMDIILKQGIVYQVRAEIKEKWDELQKKMKQLEMNRRKIIERKE